MIVDKTHTGPNGSFHYIDWGGSGPLTHIAHATGFCARVYTPLAQRLRTHLQVVGMDDRGHGRTTAPADPKRLKSWHVFANDLESLIEHLGGPVVLMGHSRGGVASLMLAVRRPDLARALVLIDPTILPLSWAWWTYPIKKLGLARYVPIAAHAARRRNGWQSKEAILEAYKGKGIFKNWTDGFLEGYVADGTQVTDEGKVRLTCDPSWESRCFATFCHYAWGYVRRLCVPTLVLYGRESDTFLPAAIKRFQHLAPKTTFIGYEKTSHFVPMERPDETTRDITDFLRDHKIL